MSLVHGFSLCFTQDIPELRIAASLYRHEQTGAELLSLRADDPNKVFCITFTTPPADSSGVAHILEHAVLCGSRKYPVKEPFVELLKGSLHTFLNACTYPDRTCYPVASQNLRDFYNLIDVYCDAVFYPLLLPVVFRQEGWHYATEPPHKQFFYRGVVFNEMKGAYSSAESLLAQHCQASLFPDTLYRYDAGGNPEQIPSLTYEQFRAFHRTYYHPSNSKIFFYGDDDPHERLRFMHSYLSAFEPQNLHVPIPQQPLRPHPRTIMQPFPASSSPAALAKGMAAVNWLLPVAKNPDTVLACSVLEYILLGMPASPLRKTLLDAGLGEGIAGVGLDSDLAQLYFSTGLKGVQEERLSDVEPLVLEALATIVRTGIDSRTRDAALNTIEFRLRENNSGRLPRGLVLLLRSLTTWLYGGNPCDMIAFAAPLERLHQRCAASPRFFEDLAERVLLANLHRTTVMLKPDPQLAQQQELREHERCAQRIANLSEDERSALVAAAQEVVQWQQTPDPPEALASIPRLRHADLDRNNMLIPCTVSEKHGARILFHDLFTSGICYLDICLNLHLLPSGAVAAAPLLGRALLETGTATEDFVSLSQRIGQTSGGITTSTFASGVNKTAQGTVWLILRAKAMYRQVPEVLSILTEVLLTAQLENRERVQQILSEEKATHEQLLIPHGHQVVSTRLRARFHEADWADEQMNGASYLLFLREHEQHTDKVSELLTTLRDTVVSRSSLVVNVTADGDAWRTIEPEVHAFLERIPERGRTPCAWAVPSLPQAEALRVPAQVNFVGKAVNLYDHGYTYHGSMQVMTNLVRTTWLWDRIRVQGGAYGAFCSFDRMSGTLVFVSYRDPRVLETLEVFDHTPDFLRTAAADPSLIERGIIGTIGDIDQPLLPDARGLVSLQRYLNGNTDELRQQMREQVLATGPEDLCALATILESARDTGNIVILGSDEKIEEANRSLNNSLQQCILL